MPAAATTNPAPEAPVYRPVSVLAIAGLTLGVLHALGVIVIGVSAWRHGTPLLIPWILVLAGAGCLMSGAAWLQITRSEVTQAGLGLAKGGWWLSLLFGLGYATHILFIELAVRADSTTFANGWLDQLRNGDVLTAFYYTLPPAQRQGDDPADVARLRIRYQLGARGQKGPLAQFLDHDLVRILQQAGADAQVEAQGVQSWEYVGGGYLAELQYRLTTPEGVYEVILPTWTGESQGTRQEYEGRQSHVLMNELLTIRPRGQTVLGQGMRALRQSGCRFLDDWGKKLSQSQLAEAYLDTHAPEDRSRLHAVYAARLALFGLAAGNDPQARWIASVPLADAELGREWCLPGYDNWLRQGLFRTDNLQSANAGEVRDELKDLMRRAPSQSLHVQVPEGTLQFTSPWKFDSGNLQLTVPIEMRLGTKYRIQGTALLSLQHRLMLQEVLRWQQNRPATVAAPGNPDPLPRGVADSWRLHHIDLATGTDVSARGN